MIEVSVIIPTWNRRKYLPRAIQSVLIQQDVSFEIIVVDDGSTDGTALMIRQEFPSVTYLFQENRGPAAARNSGLKHANGEWIAFLDSDDVWKPGKLRVQLDFFQRYPEFKICQTEEIWIRRERRVNPMKKHRKFGGQIFEKCLPLCIVSPSAVMIHRNIFDDVGLFDESYPACEDYELWLRIAARYPIGLVKKPYIIKYGGHDGQRSREFPALDCFRIRAIAGILKSGRLDPEQKTAACQMLGEKLKIYTQGAMKRGKKKEIRELEDLVKNCL